MRYFGKLKDFVPGTSPFARVSMDELCAEAIDKSIRLELVAAAIWAQRCEPEGLDKGTEFGEVGSVGLPVILIKTCFDKNSTSFRTSFSVQTLTRHRHERKYLCSSDRYQCRHIRRHICTRKKLQTGCRTCENFHFHRLVSNPLSEQAFRPHRAHCWAHNLCLAVEWPFRQTARSQHAKECGQGGHKMPGYQVGQVSLDDVMECF